MTPQVSSPAVQKQQFPSSSGGRPRRAYKSFYPFLALMVLLLLIFTILLLSSLSELVPYTNPAAQSTLPFQSASGATVTSFQVPGGQEVVYVQQNHIYAVAALPGSTPRLLDTPGYIYNRALPPQLTPQGQLLYSGDGIWLADLSSGRSRQIATISAGQVITALALSSDGNRLAWSSAPKDGRGSIRLYAGPLEATSLVYQHTAGQCPCLRVFSFLHGTGQQADTTLLLTDDRGDQRNVRYGVWMLDVGQSAAQPRPLLPENLQQGPLALATEGNALLYSSYEGFVAAPTNGGAPRDIDALSYANSLLLTTISGLPPRLSKAQVLVPEQKALSNSAAYHWITTPQFSPDGHTLVYVEFSSDAANPFTRHSALYSVQLQGSGAQLRASSPRLLATTTASYVELDGWLNNHTFSLYADNALYVFDMQRNAIAQVAQPGSYAYGVAMTQQKSA